MCSEYARTVKTLSPTQQACLEAMGIDVWVARDSTTIDPVTMEQVVSAEQPPLGEKSFSPDRVVNKPNYAIPENIAPAEAIPQSHTEKQKASIDLPQDWNGLYQAAASCQSCALHDSRTQVVFGEGSQTADWLIIGDAPSEEEDKIGQPFKGHQGELLTAMLRAIGLSRQQVYLANIIKCKTPNNRDAETSESDSCMQYLKQQINLIQPKLILVVGQSAAQRLLSNHSTLARLRQKVHQLEGFNIPVIVTYHPSSLLTQPANKRDAWHDLLLAQKTISAEAVL